jgi:hypothetical protein
MKGHVPDPHPFVIAHGPVGPLRGRATGHDRVGTARRELERTTHVVGVDMSVEGRHDLDTQLIGEREVRVDVARWIDRDRLPISDLDQIGGVGEGVVVQRMHASGQRASAGAANVRSTARTDSRTSFWS